MLLLAAVSVAATVAVGVAVGGGFVVVGGVGCCCVPHKIYQNDS